MIYYSNGGFNWNDVYFMPTKLREFYFKELLKTKEAEREAMNSNKPQTSNNSSKTRRK